jgi:hypothetical protein
MAIEINKSTTRVEPPMITIRGARVDDNGDVGNSTDSVRTVQDVVQEDNTVRNREEWVFYDDVTVTLTPDSKFDSNVYSNRSVTDFVGKTRPDTDDVNLKADTYYTVNGKDPSRTKANLYTGHFVIKRNLSGTDNIVLKTKTYVQGQESKTRKIDFRIIRKRPNLV